MKKIKEFYLSLSPDVKKTSLLIFLTYFFVLFSYPLVRSSIGALFYENYTGSDYPLATFIGVIGLMVLISINNKLQPKYGAHKVYLLTGLLTVASLILAFYSYKQGIKEMAFALFAIKEGYIVILVHACLAFANSFYDIDLFKKIIGPIGAFGSIGGILGGQLTSYLAAQTSFGTEGVFYISLISILLTVFIFYQTRHVKVKGLEPNKSITPIHAIRGVRKYVFLIACVVTLSQFVIFIADLQFNLIFEKTITLKNERTQYLGNFYSIINGLSLFLQFVILPVLLSRFKNKTIFLAIPFLYLCLIIIGMGGVASPMILAASIFIIMKGTDYSLFAVAKEVMYHPLLSLQKYGAKYLTDMFVYRAAKALIAFVMAQAIIKEYLEQVYILEILQFFFLILWIFLAIKLF